MLLSSAMFCIFANFSWKDCLFAFLSFVAEDYFMCFNVNSFDLGFRVAVNLVMV